MSEADAGDLEQPQPLQCLAYNWKPKSSAQKQHGSYVSEDSVYRASHDSLARALCFMNTGRSHSYGYKVLTYGLIPWMLPSRKPC